MRSFDQVDWESLPEGKLVLMTVETIVKDATMAVADFRDVQALVFTKTGNYLGMSPTRGLRFGKSPASMQNGVWLVTEDMQAEQGWEDIQPATEDLSLEIIK
jgi:hypothetical protein